MINLSPPNLFLVSTLFCLLLSCSGVRQYMPVTISKSQPGASNYANTVSEFVSFPDKVLVTVGQNSMNNGNNVEKKDNYESPPLISEEEMKQKVSLL